MHAPAGFRFHQDKLDGYSFIYPDNWIPVTTSGNDVFFRNPRQVHTSRQLHTARPVIKLHLGPVGLPSLHHWLRSVDLLCRNVNENVFVNISSPSSSRYTAVSDIGSPDKVRCAAQMALLTLQRSESCALSAVAGCIAARFAVGSHEGAALWKL